jgi:hypothetical protein
LEGEIILAIKRMKPAIITNYFHFALDYGPSCLKNAEELSLGVPGELLALLEIALYVEPGSAALPTQAFTFEKLRGLPFPL